MNSPRNNYRFPIGHPAETTSLILKHVTIFDRGPPTSQKILVSSRVDPFSPLYPREIFFCQIFVLVRPRLHVFDAPLPHLRGMIEFPFLFPIPPLTRRQGGPPPGLDALTPFIPASASRTYRLWIFFSGMARAG